MTRHAIQSLIRLTHPSKVGPPFVQVLPCPWCGAIEDRGHVAEKHVDEDLGTRGRGTG